MAKKPTPPAERKLGAETLRSHQRRLAEGFYDRYLGGEHVLDIGFRGGRPDAEPVTAKAIGVELDYPGYDGTHLPFPDESQDAVFASHTLEHITDWQTVLADWFRVLKIGGYLVIAVPHAHLYERKSDLPSRFNGDHKRFYTPASFLKEIETALPIGCYRVRSLRDVDDGFVYSVPATEHPKGCYEIEAVVQKIAPPPYAGRLTTSPQAIELARFAANMLTSALAAQSRGAAEELLQIQTILMSLPLPAFRLLERHLPDSLTRADIVRAMRPWLEAAPFDEQDYIARYPDIAAAVKAGKLPSGQRHYVNNGYIEGRFANPVPDIFA